MSDLQLACVHSRSETARAMFAALERSHEFVAPEVADVVVVLGGDGFMLHSLHQYHALERPFFGVNCGTLGFLLNERRDEDLTSRIEKATEQVLQPLLVESKKDDGETDYTIAFNEAAVVRYSGQSVNLRVTVNDVERLGRFVGDGIILATPAGSTAYNFSAHGPIVPLGSSLLALTPVSPFRPRRWRGALLPHTSVVELENLDPVKRPTILAADFHEIGVIQRVRIRKAPEISVRLLFDPDQSLEERVLSEQFTTR